MGNAELLELLIKARSTAHIDGILRGLRVVDPEEYFFDPHGNPSVKWKPGCLHWVPVGRDRGNSGRIKLAGEPTGPIAERSINGMEAIIELERLLELLKRPTAPMPSTPRAAVLRYFGLPRLEDVPAMDREERRTMRDRINAVRKKLEVHLKKRTRPVYNWQLRTIDKAVGERVISSLAGKDFRLWYNQFKRPTEPGGTEHIPKAHGLITMVRALVSFGVQWRVPDAATLRGVLSEMKFQNAPAREEFVTYEMALAFIAKAHELGEHNMAFAQALQFDLTLRQTDVIGTWEPKDDDPTILEPVSGLCWQHIDRGTHPEIHTREDGRDDASEGEVRFEGIRPCNGGTRTAARQTEHRPDDYQSENRLAVQVPHLRGTLAQDRYGSRNPRRGMESR